MVLMLTSAVVFAGGSSEESAASDGVTTIRYWQHSSAARDEMMLKVIEMFEAQYPQYKVEAEFIPEADYNQRLIPALATNTAPDVFQIQQGMVSKLAEVGSIQPLDNSVMSTESIQSDYLNAAVDGLNYNGMYYGMPTDTQTIILLYNKDHFRAAGLDPENPPQTWDEFFDAARKLTIKDENGNLVQSGWGGKGYWCEVAAFVVQHGGTMNDENGDFNFADNPASVEAIRQYISFYKDGNYSTSFTANWAGFRQGLISMMLGHPAMIGNLVTTAPNLDYGVALIPAYEGRHTTCISSWAYVASSRADSVAATTFIQFLASEEVERMWTEETGQLPVSLSLVDDPSIASDPKIALAIDSLKDSFVGTLQTGALNSIWDDGMERIRDTDADLETVLHEMQTALNEELHTQL